MSSGRCQASDGGSWYAPLHRRTREPGTPRARQSSSVRWSDAWSTAPVEGKSWRIKADETQRRIGGGVVLHVDRHRRAGGAGGVADRTRVVERHGLVERLPDRGELHRHLRAGGEAVLGQAAGERAVCVHRGTCRGGVAGVLAEMVERDLQPAGGQVPGRRGRASSMVSPATKRRTTSRVTGADVTARLI